MFIQTGKLPKGLKASRTGVACLLKASIATVTVLVKCEYVYLGKSYERYFVNIPCVMVSLR